MTSRLDRLFILLESGSSAVTRRAAAKQIGEVQKLYPHELHALLNRLIGYLHSSSWDTRIAAAQTVEAILHNVPEWKPELLASIKREVKREDVEEDSCHSTSSAVSSINTSASDYKERLLTFSDFNVEQILQKGARLIGSEGNEFDEEIASGSNAAERLSQQRAMLNEKLGLNKFGLHMSDMITDEDMMTRNTSSGNAGNLNEEKVPVDQILNIRNRGNLLSSNGQQLSSREINRAKRKARLNAAGSSCAAATVTASSSTSLSRSCSLLANNGNGSSNSSIVATASNNNNSSGNGCNDEPEVKKLKIENKVQEIYYSLDAPVPDATGSWIDAISWPLESFCARLYVDLINAKWEVRHGAATALRELINLHAAGAGKTLTMTREEMQQNHNLWLVDAALRLLCVLCLDRFGDFISDQVVAPVRETCAQVLGTIVKDMDAEQVNEIVKMLLKLLQQTDWEVRHGGLLGLKYVFVVRQELLPTYLPQTIPAILLGLFDTVDDVGAVAASTLIPVAAWLPKLLNTERVSKIISMLWDLLLEQDELTSACNSFMGLLAAILCLPNSNSWIQLQQLPELVPRLWPFLSHNNSSVRKSTLVTLQMLTGGSTIKTEKSIAANGEESKADKCSLHSNFGIIGWHWKLLQEAMRHIYQRILVEPQAHIQEMAARVWLSIIQNSSLGALLHAACPYVSSWICFAMQPQRLAFDSNTFLHANSCAGKQTAAVDLTVDTPRRRAHRDDLGAQSAANVTPQKLFLGGNESTPAEIRERNFMRARITAARLLGALSHYLVQPAPGVEYTPEMESPMDCYTKVLLGHLNSRSAVQRTVCGLIIAFWAQSDVAVRPGPLKLQEKLHYCVMEYVYYDEVAIAITRLLQETHDFIATLKQYKVPINDFNNAKILSLEQIAAVATTLTENLRQNLLKPKILDTLEERRKGLQNSHQQTSTEQCALNISAQAALAGAIVCLHCLPEKLNPVVKPLMESIKREDCELLQELSAEFLVQLMDQVCDRNPSPNSKILTNLCMLLRSDAEFTPKIETARLSLLLTKLPATINNECIYYGILTLSKQQTSANAVTNHRIATNGASTSRGPGRPSLQETLAAAASTEQAIAAAAQQAEQKRCRTQRLGATCAISKLCQVFGADIFRKLPNFHELMFAKIEQYLATHPAMEKLHNITLDLVETNHLVTSLQLIEIAATHMHISLQEQIFELLPHFAQLIAHPLKAIRHLVARCIATLASIDACRTMNFVVQHLVTLLQDINNIIHRQGAIEAIESVVDKLQIRIVPYIVLLVVPLLGCMSDPDESVRLLSTHCFATLIQLMPLDSKNAGKSEIKLKELEDRKSRDREFLDYLFLPKTIPDYKVPVKMSVELRTYQQAGVNWLWFLNKYNLHGILCDDMGLGKTLQTICILAGDHHQRLLDKAIMLPSIVICPPTLTGHWVYEVDKFLKNSSVLRTLHYVGLPQGRERLRSSISHCNLVVCSYDTVRKDIEFLSGINWNYCVLDEGHFIKNGKTKGSKAIKMLKANHRLILSGTPIQNNVLELWSLFDFLMPGFLGTEKQFIGRYSRPILASRDAKSTAKEQEAGVLAMESLHRQVLPFLLRRVKEDVLTDLPPKITQDLLCELSPLQERLYEDFSRSHLNSDLKDCLENLGESENINSKTHIFHALRYLQNVCNHPKLVLTASHPEYQKITQELLAQESSLHDIEHSAKLPALKQLLLDCGIGVQTESVSQHRALIFCQLKAMLDIVERDLLRRHLPAVSYLRLDGSVPASMRQEIVNNFNSDPSIDVLLLTTQVGGLGLNLTGADTVIFVEHDWNPMKDLQAMDRAHRIGQKKVVNVYRLITRKSLEQKIMGLQKFKILTANTVVSSENASMDTMGTEQLFDLFTLNENQNGKDKDKATMTTKTGQSSVNSILQNLPDLWSESQYEEEYDLTSFVQSLKK